MHLRPYQWDAIRYSVDALLQDKPAVGIVAPTGAGKSTIITALLIKMMPGKVAAIVAAPQQAIEQGFCTEQPETLFPPIDSGRRTQAAPLGDNDIYAVLRTERDKFTSARDILQGVNAPAKRVALTTHQQLVRWDDDILLDDMTGRILILDEAHHAGAEDDELGTKLGFFAKKWMERGGQVVFVTATPYRNDGQSVLPDGTPAYTWTIAQHAQSGFAPLNFSLGTIPTGIEVSNPTEYSGEDLPEAEGQGGTGYTQMVEQWVREGKPKAVFIVPAKRSAEWATNLEHALTKEGARVCNAVGTDEDTKDRFMAALDIERKATSYADSKVDVFLACKRYDEGTDWALCSHVYQWGVPSSFGLVIQRWGRAFRDKKRYPDYPAQFRQEARLNFFIPKIRAGAEDSFEKKHRQHVWILGAHLADWATGRQYGPVLHTQYDFIREARSKELEDIASLFGDMLDNLSEDSQESLSQDERERIATEQALTIPEHRRAEALCLMTQAEVLLQKMKTDGTPPSIAEVLDALETRGFSDEILADVKHLFLERVVESNPSAAAEFRKALGKNLGARDPLSRIIHPNLKDMFTEVLEPYRHLTVPVADATIGYITQFTGETALEVSSRLREALNKPDLTIEMIKAAVTKHRDTNEGKNPTQDSDGATDCFEFTEEWANVDEALRKGRRGLPKGSSLSKFLVEHGFAEAKPDFTVEMIKAAITKHRDTHKGESPTKDSDGATACFEFPETWANVNAALYYGRRGLPKGSSLSKFLIEHGFAEAKPEKPDTLTPEMIKSAIVKFRDTHKGKNPSAVSGNATDCFKFTETWNSVDSALRHGRRGLPKGSSLFQFLVEHGFAEAKPDFTIEMIKAAVIKFRDTHNGENPTKNSDGATECFGFTETWARVNQALYEGLRGFPKGSSLYKFLVEHGFAEAKPDFTPEMIKAAIVKFRDTHGGKNPTEKSDDATACFGFTEEWASVDSALRHGRRGLPKGSSLFQFLVEHGFAKPEKPDFTIEMIKAAVIKFRDTHNGENPTQDSGNATDCFGFTETWGSVDQALRKGSRGLPNGSSLFQFCKDLPR